VPRDRKKEALFTTEELAVIELASARRGLRPGAFIAATAVEAARSITSADSDRPGAVDHAAAAHELREFTGEVRELRRLLGNVAGNLNDVARHANSTGEVGANADAVLDYTRRMNTRIDSWLMEMLRSLR